MSKATSRHGCESQSWEAWGSALGEHLSKTGAMSFWGRREEDVASGHLVYNCAPLNQLSWQNSFENQRRFCKTSA